MKMDILYIIIEVRIINQRISLQMGISKYAIKNEHVPYKL